MNKVEAVITIFEPNHLLTLYFNYLVFIIIIFLIQFIFLSKVSSHYLLDIILQNFFKFPQIFFKFSSFANSSNFVKRVSFHTEKMFPSV